LSRAFEFPGCSDRKSLDSMIRAIEAQTQDLKSTLAGMKDIIQNVEVTKYQRNATSNGGGIEDYQKGIGEVCDLHNVYKSFVECLLQKYGVAANSNEASTWLDDIVTIQISVAFTSFCPYQGR
jgi:hypothetical protein